MANMNKKPIKKIKKPVTLPIIFTDRAAFDRYVGSYTLLTLDAPDQVLDDPLTSSSKATYGNLITFTFDLQGGVGVNADGTVTLGKSNLIASGTVLQPVTAFGFDIVSADARSIVYLTASGIDLRVSLAGLHFLGLVSENAFNVSLSYTPLLDPVLNDIIGGFTIDNVAIKTAP
jgi:hypothetical protein